MRSSIGGNATGSQRVILSACRWTLLVSTEEHHMHIRCGFKRKPATRQCPSADGTTLFSCLSHFQPTPEPAASLAGSSRPKPDTTATRLVYLNSCDHILPHPRGCSICLLIPRCLGCRAAKHSRRQPQSMGVTLTLRSKHARLAISTGYEAQLCVFHHKATVT